MNADICIPDTDWGCASEAWVEALDPVVKHRAEVLAWTTLQALSGYQLSLCSVSVRPCAKRCTPGNWDAYPFAGGANGSFSPYIERGSWYNACGCRTNCECVTTSRIELPGGSSLVAEVLIDGIPLDADEYHIESGRWLVANGDLQFPICQDFTQISGPGTFIVRYWRGDTPTITGAYSAGVLAVEFAKACNGEKNCRLPDGVTQVTRAGMSMEIQAGLFPNGYTGIREVDAWLFTVNPHGLRAPSTVLSPDFKPARF